MNTPKFAIGARVRGMSGSIYEIVEPQVYRAAATGLRWSPNPNNTGGVYVRVLSVVPRAACPYRRAGEIEWVDANGLVPIAEDPAAVLRDLRISDPASALVQIRTLSGRETWCRVCDKDVSDGRRHGRDCAAAIKGGWARLEWTR